MVRHFPRRRFRGAAAVLAVLGLFTGCGTQSSARSAPTAASSSVSPSVTATPTTTPTPSSSASPESTQSSDPASSATPENLEAPAHACTLSDTTTASHVIGAPMHEDVLGSDPDGPSPFSGGYHGMISNCSYWTHPDAVAMSDHPYDPSVSFTIYTFDTDAEARNLGPQSLPSQTAIRQGLVHRSPHRRVATLVAQRMDGTGPAVQSAPARTNAQPGSRSPTATRCWWWAAITSPPAKSQHGRTRSPRGPWN